MSTKHNPAGLTPEQIPAGHRLLDEDEIVKAKETNPEADVLCWVNGRWHQGHFGSSVCDTYCTHHSRVQLEAARNLPPETQPEGGDATCPDTNVPSVDTVQDSMSSLTPGSNAAAGVQSSSAAVSELLPCPFCGGPARVLTDQVSVAMCDGCDAEGPASESEEGAIRQWNRRAIDSATASLRAEVERLTAGLKKIATNEGEDNSGICRYGCDSPWLAQRTLDGDAPLPPYGEDGKTVAERKCDQLTADLATARQELAAEKAAHEETRNAARNLKGESK